MYMKKNNKGFTLIELLVVIAIIGILASIILVSLNTAREKGKDSSAIGSFSAIRSQAEIFLTDNNVYTGLFADPGVIKLITAAETKTAHTATTGADATHYYAVIQLGADTTKDFCVDDTGFAGKVDNPATVGSGDWTCN